MIVFVLAILLVNRLGSSFKQYFFLQESFQRRTFFFPLKSKVIIVLLREPIKLIGNKSFIKPNFIHNLVGFLLVCGFYKVDFIIFIYVFK